MWRRASFASSLCHYLVSYGYWWQCAVAWRPRTHLCCCYWAQPHVGEGAGFLDSEATLAPPTLHQVIMWGLHSNSSSATAFRTTGSATVSRNHVCGYYAYPFPKSAYPMNANKITFRSTNVWISLACY